MMYENDKMPKSFWVGTEPPFESCSGLGLSSI